MSAREPPPSSPPRPPPLFGFALYLAGTGCAFMGAAQLTVFLTIHRWLSSSYGLVTRWGMPIGEVMVFAGLALAWRTSRPPRRRFVAVATTLWLAMSVIDLEQAKIRQRLALEGLRGALAPTAATLAGWAIALGLLAMVVHAGARALGARTWPTTLGACLVVADAFEQAWPVVVPQGAHAGAERASLVSLVVLDAVGLLIFAFGLFASGRLVLLGGAPTKPRPEDEGLGALAARDGLPLVTEASVASAGLAAALALALAASSSLGVTTLQLTTLSVLGGQLVASLLLVLGLRTLGSTARAPLRLATASLVSLIALVIALAALRMHPRPFPLALLQGAMAVPVLLTGASLHVAASRPSLGTLEARVSLRASLRSTGVLLGLGGALALASSLVPMTAVPDAEAVLRVAQVVVALLALFFAVRVASAPGRVAVTAPQS